MIVAIGTDLVEIARIERLLQRAGERFLGRVFTAAERAYCLGRQHPAQSLAARFAAKEAVMKCLGTGLAAGIGFRQIEVLRDARGQPGIGLSGAAAARAEARGIRSVLLSLSHTEHAALAFAVATG